MSQPSERSARYEAFGESKSLTEWSKDPRCEVPYRTLYSRVKAGRALEEALQKHAPFQGAECPVVTVTPNPVTADVLCQNLTDALNALVNAGRFPYFHDLYGLGNTWQHQPYAIAGSHADAPWVVFDLASRQFTVSSRERVRNGEHSGRKHG